MPDRGDVHADREEGGRGGEELAQRVPNDGGKQDSGHSSRLGAVPEEAVPRSHRVHHILCYFTGGLHWKELVYTTKDYFRGVTAIEANWISELVPEWFSSQHSSCGVCNKYSSTNDNLLLLDSGLGLLRNGHVENAVLALGLHGGHVGAFGEIEFMGVFLQGRGAVPLIGRAETLGGDGQLVSHRVHRDIRLLHAGHVHVDVEARFVFLLVYILRDKEVEASSAVLLGFRRRRGHEIPYALVHLLGSLPHVVVIHIASIRESLRKVHTTK